MSKTLILLFSASVLCGQYQDLATNYTGDIVYFSGLQTLRDKTSYSQLKLYALQHGQLTILETGANLSRYFPPSLAQSGTPFAVNRAEICPSARCLSPETFTTTIHTTRQTFRYFGQASLSPNGRFAMLSSPIEPLNKVDLATGQSFPVGLAPALEGQFISDNGTVIVTALEGIRLISPTTEVLLKPSRPMRRAILSFDASLIVYDVATPPFEIRILNASTGQDEILGPGQQPMLANNGRTLTYLSNSQLQIADLTNRSTRTIPTREPIEDHTLSGNGQIAIATTKQGNLVSIQTQTGQTTQLLEFALTSPSLKYPAVPGSYNEIIGTFPPGFIPEFDYGDSKPILLGKTEHGFAIQFLWEAKLKNGESLLLTSKNSPWVYQVSSNTNSAQSQILRFNSKYAIIHEHWDALVTDENPARRGETIHLFATGFGPVENPPTSGQPTPTDRLYPLTATCQWAGSLEAGTAFGFKATFAGLAPGLIGVYQLDFYIPTNWPYPTLAPFCQSSGYQLNTIPIPLRN